MDGLGLGDLELGVWWGLGMEPHGYASTSPSSRIRGEGLGMLAPWIYVVLSFTISTYQFCACCFGARADTYEPSDATDPCVVARAW